MRNSTFEREVTEQVAEPPFDDRPVLDVRDLQTYFFMSRGVGKAVDRVSFSIRPRETLGLVGESGCGKSMTCLSIMRLNPKPASRVIGGQVFFRGTDLLSLPEREMRSYRGRHIGLILQDPATALNPVFTIGEQVYESLRQLSDHPRGQTLRDRATELLRLLRIDAPETRLMSYPHELSGGMRQRVVGAIALAGKPEVIIADEPTTSLDVTIQAAYLELLKDLQRRLGISILFVTHDFGVVAKMCDRVAVMYAGKIVESAYAQPLLTGPAHPYTRALLDSLPTVSALVDRLHPIEGHPPSIYSLPSGCRFHPRCPLRNRLGRPLRCEEDEPVLRELLPGHFVACHFAEEIAAEAGATEESAATDSPPAAGVPSLAPRRTAVAETTT
jgi:oligopeptide/dipeptide ABC transporter ATP-binding protein